MYYDEVGEFDDLFGEGGWVGCEVDVGFVDDYDVVLGWVGEDWFDGGFGEEGVGWVIWGVEVG